MAIHILISVYDESISTEQFDSFDAARAKMMEELGDELIRYGEEDEWNEVKDLEAFSNEEVGYYGYGFSKDCASCYIDHKCSCQWQIVEVK